MILSTLNWALPEIRLDGQSVQPCGHAAAVNTLTDAVYHEGRHAYHALIARNFPTGTSPSNDGDSGWLVVKVDIAPFETLKDSTDKRKVCNEYQGADGGQDAVYLGDFSSDLDGLLADGTPDKRLCRACNYVWYAVEEDAFAFASRKTGKE